MKRKFLLSLTSLLLIGSLVACNGPKKNSEKESEPASNESVPGESDYSPDSGEQGESTPAESEPAESEPTESEPAESEPAGSEESTPAETDGWTADDIALMDDFLYGVHLPYPGTEMIGYYDAEYEAISFISEADDLTADFAAGYAAMFDQNWEVEEDDDVYYAMMEVETEAGTRYAQVQFAIVDEDGYVASTGYFMLLAYDPFVYEWPAELVEMVVEYFESEATVPAFEADRYQLVTDYITYAGYMGIYCYTEAANAEATYAAALKEARFTVSEEVNNDGFYQAISENEDLLVEFVYDDDYKDLDIYISEYEPPVVEWPAEDAAALVQYFAQGSTTVIPALEGGDKYDVLLGADNDLIDIFGYGEIDVYGDADLVTTFEGVLKEANWTETDDGFVSPAEDILVWMKYSASYGCVEVYITGYEAPLTEWPSEDAADIVEVLVPGSETVIPALDGGTKYDVYADAEMAEYYGAGEIDVYGDATLEETYVAILKAAEWTEVDDGYLSPAEDILIDLYYRASYGCLEITITAYVKPSEEWPADQIAEAFGEKVTDPIPAFEGDNNGFKFDEYNGYLYITVAVEDGTAETALETYRAALLAANYVEDENSEGLFTSPNGQVTIMVYADGTDALQIILLKDPWLDALDEFPLEEVNAFLAEYDLGFTLTEALPDDANKGFVLETGSASGYAYIAITFSGDQVEALNAILEPIVTANGYSVNEDASNGYDYFNEDYHEVQIYLNNNGDTEVVFFE